MKFRGFVGDRLVAIGDDMWNVYHRVLKARRNRYLKGDLTLYRDDGELHGVIQEEDEVLENTYEGAYWLFLHKTRPIGDFLKDDA